MLLVLARRIALAIPVSLLMSALLFFSVAGLLGSPAALMLGADATLDSIAALEKQLGFDRPLLTQYLDWMEKAVTGDLGRSYSTRQTVAQTILPRIPVTFELACLAILVAAVSATFVNSLTVGQRAIRPVATAVAIAGITLPNFVIGLGLMFLFAVKLGWLPTIGWAPLSGGLGTHLTHIALPVLTLSGFYFGSISLVYRAEYDANCERLFVQVARAKGLSPTEVSFLHVLPNSILPVITDVGLSLGQLMGGAVVVETMFSMPGLGSLLVDSIFSRDYPVMLAVGMMAVMAVVVMNALADALYTVANPQIRIA